MKKNDRHICIISPSLKIGGIERALSILANYFTEKGLEVTFISCLSGDHFYKLSNKVKLIEPFFKHTGGIKSGIIYYPKLLRFIRYNVKKVDPYVVLAFGDWFSPLVLFALYGTKYPVYISDRTSPDYKFKFPIPLLKRWLYPKSAGFIAQTSRAAVYKRKIFGGKLNIKVIPNAIREVKKYDIPRENIILYVGRFAWEKGPEKLIKAFAKIQEKQGWKLYMAGSGPMLDDMKQYAIDLGCKADIIFLGKVKEVDKLYSKAKIYVLPSVLEGFPNSLCEAMSAGLASICFDSIPYEDIFKPNESGIVIKYNDVNALSKQLSYLIENRDKRKSLGDNALEIKQRLSVELIGEKVLNFMQIGYAL